MSSINEEVRRQAQQRRAAEVLLREVHTASSDLLTASRFLALESEVSCTE